MSRLDIRWMWRHPLKWGKAVGFQLAVAVLLFLKAALITDPLWEVTAWSQFSPIALGAAGAMCVASAVAPADRRLQIVTMLTLLGVATWRVATYLLLLGSDVTPGVALLAEAFTLHWAFVGAVATRWPIISTKAALIVTVEAGRDQEPLRAAG